MIKNKNKIRKKLGVNVIQNKEIKTVIIGSSSVGKSSICFSYTTNTFPNYPINVTDNYYISEKYEGKTYNINLVDTPGEESYENLRSLCYPDTDVVILVFSIISKTSFKEAATYWRNEIRSKLQGLPIILIGNKLDKKESIAERFEVDVVSTSDGKKLARKIGAEKYIECSARTQEGLKEVFKFVCRIKST